MNTYAILKTAHIISASILFGTGLGIAFFAWFGYRIALAKGEISGLRTVLKLTVLGDAIFTAPAVVFQFVSGVVLMHLDSWALTSPWGVTVLAIFILIGLFWLPVVWIQYKMKREADSVQDIQSLSPGFHLRFRLWFVLGIPAFSGVIVLFFMMVARPLSVASW